MHDGAGTLQRRVRSGLGPLVRRVWDIETRGFDRLPVEGPAILCPNHVSFLDSAFLMFTVRRNISFVGKAEYLDSWATRVLFPAMGMIPIDRAGGERSAAALETAKRVLRRGELFGVFPEGTRSRTGRLYKGRTGAARLAMDLDCPIFPVGITGTDEIQPPGARMPKLGRSCRIEIGRPVSPDRHRDRSPEHLAWRSMTDEVMFEIREMTGQEYVHAYADEDRDEDRDEAADRPRPFADVVDLPARRRGRPDPTPVGGLALVGGGC